MRLFPTSELSVAEWVDWVEENLHEEWNKCVNLRVLHAVAKLEHLVEMDRIKKEMADEERKGSIKYAIAVEEKLRERERAEWEKEKAKIVRMKEISEQSWKLILNAFERAKYSNATAPGGVPGREDEIGGDI